MKTPDWARDFVNGARIAGPRVLLDGQAFSRAAAAEIVRRLAELQERRGMTAGRVARGLGMEEAALAAGIASADERILRALDAWMEQQQSKTGNGGFATTGAAERIFAAMRWAQEIGGIVAVYGPAGAGKTTALQAACGMTPGAIFTSVCAMGVTGKAVLEPIAAVLGVPMAASRSVLFRDLVDALEDSGRLIVIDEIQRLADRRHDEGLHALRDLQDATGVPMIWAGMPTFARYLQQGRARGFEPLDQLHSRISLWLDLEEPASGSKGGPGGGNLASIEDVRRFLERRQLRFTPDGERWVLALVNQPGAGAWRALDKLLPLVAKLAAGRPITADMLRGVQAMRLGLHAAEVMENGMAARETLREGVA